MFTLLIITLAFVLVLRIGTFYQARGVTSDKRTFPPIGRLVSIGNCRLHLVESGQGRPVIIFESGIAASSLNWTAMQTQAALFTRACAYDRAGLGWSDPPPAPRDIRELIKELRSLIGAAEIPGPYLLVGHSFGGLVVQAYAVAHPHEVAGLVLIDPLPACEWRNPSAEQARMLRWGIALSRRGALLARFGLVRASLALLSGGSRRIPKLVAKLSSGSAESTLSRIVGEVQKMPPEVWPMIQAHWCQQSPFSAWLSILKLFRRAARRRQLWPIFP